MRIRTTIGSAAWATILLVTALALGCGGGGGSTSTPDSTNPAGTDTGKTSQATITQSNAKALTEAGSYSAPLSSVAGGPQQDEPSVESGSVARVGAAALTQETASGNCGGTARFDSEYDSITGNISGTTTYTGYCQDGVTEQGQTAFAGTFAAADFSVDLLFTFTDYAADNILTNGTAALQGTLQDGILTSGNLLLDALIKDIDAGDVLRMEAVRTAIAATAEYTDLTIQSGKIYHPDFGYAELLTAVPLRTNSTDQHPSSGALVMVGANNTKARVTYLSNTQYMVEVDETGSGIYTLVGTYDWKTLSSSNNKPTVTSVAPASGAVGATVTITGTNFSATPAGNTLTFNGASATVTSATPTQLVAVIPSGAATGAISVTTGAGTVSSSAAFVVTTSNNDALVGLWMLATENGQPPPADISTAVILNPDNTYVMAIIENSTGNYCTESGTYGSDGAALTTTVTESTCEPADVNTTTTASYQVSGDTLTTTAADGPVAVWGKEVTVQPQLVGTWGDLSASGADYYNTINHTWSPVSGFGAKYTFNPDGTFTYGLLSQFSLYACSTKIWVWLAGTYSVNGNDLTLAETEHYKKVQDTCSSGSNFDGPLPLETKTWRWSIEQVANTFAGESWYTGPASHTTLFLTFGESRLPYPRKE